MASRPWAGSWLPRLHALCEAGLLPRRVAQALPPGASKDKNTRYLDIREGDAIDEAQLTKWVKQAAKLPGFLAP